MNYLWYDCLKKAYGSDINLIYTDTDSLIFNVITDDIYYDYKTKLSDIIDRSNFPPSHEAYSTQNAKKPGILKDETNGDPIIEIVCIRAKVYAIRTKSGLVDKRCKGVKRYCVKKHINFEDFKRVLFEQCEIRRSFNLIRSKLHTLYSCTQNKLAMNSFDDKRHILDDNISSLPHGYFSIKESENIL
jgi:hypothetical protein